MTVTDDSTTELDQMTPSAAWPRVAIADDLDVDLVPYLEFCGRVLRAGIAHVRQRSWATTAGSLEAVLPHAVSTSQWHRYETALLDLGGRFGSDCLAYLWLGKGDLSCRVAAHDLPALAEAEEWLRAEFPRRAATAEQSVPVTFWSVSARGGHSWARSVDVPAWSAIERNYPRAVRDELAELFTPDARPGAGGRLLLWHGEPGTGKTYALRALAWEWRSWCETHYVTDSEVFFGGRVDYLMDVVLHEPADADKWRLLVLEDTGELLAADAKERTGQGLSRLLNVVDGIFGQGLRLLVLVTTNEHLKRLHPAVARPGRCSAKVEFTAFPADEAAGWLKEAGAEPEHDAATLAVLYATAGGRRPLARKRIGFELPR
jgi:hypothetical protein